MSAVKMIIEERTADLGKFQVGRLLPHRQKRMIGPFIFIDHMGPVTLGEKDNFDVLPHPHIGLSTLTYLLDGCIVHRDTLGNELQIQPGEVNWMTAGKGIVHSERTPEQLKHKPKSMHGLQIWIALPKHLEQMNPEFFHIESNNIPVWTDRNVQFKLIAGELLGFRSPVPVYSKLYMLEIHAAETQMISFGHYLFGECGLYILSGVIETDGVRYHPNQFLVVDDLQNFKFSIEKNTTVYIFGGEPFPEERFIDWNFVSSDKSLIEEAKSKWAAQLFDKITGDDTEFTPYPERKK
jgi:redox-sensitive bicupin YhaK (pirin superfamily)